MTVVRSRLCDFLSRNGRHVPGTGDTQAHRALEEYAADQTDQEAWEREYQKSLFDWAVRQIRGRFQESTWQAFWQTAVRGREGTEVAEALGMTPGAVYVAKCRVLAQLKRRIREMDE
jgi:RNA polymerase sigma-70 factor (ECF subfamily)